jgi:hypothetical protein
MRRGNLIFAQMSRNRIVSVFCEGNNANVQEVALQEMRERSADEIIPNLRSHGLADG